VALFVVYIGITVSRGYVSSWRPEIKARGPVKVSGGSAPANPINTRPGFVKNDKDQMKVMHNQRIRQSSFDKLEVELYPMKDVLG